MDQAKTSVIVLSLFVSLSFALTALYIALTRRHKPTWVAGTLILFALAEATLARSLAGLSSDPVTQILWYNMEYIGFSIAPPAFLCLALRYAGFGHLITRRTRFLLSVFPALAVGLIFTNEIHGWMWDPANMVHIIISLNFLSASDARIG